MYKVTYDTVAILPDGREGNVSQGTGVLYTDHALPDIQRALNEAIAPRRLSACILTVERLKGIVVAKGDVA